MNNENRHIELEELLAKYFASEADADEIKEVDFWKHASEANMKVFDEYAKVWSSTADINHIEDVDVDAEWEVFQSKLHAEKNKSTKVFTLKRFLQAASILVFLQVGYLGYRIMSFTTYESTSYEMRGDIVLPDGSEVSLNANSKIILPKNFGEDSREIELEGEGYFNVTKNRDLPFVVNARGASIKVVGTEFNVRNSKEDVKVSVFEGEVEMFASSKPEHKISLISGESGTYTSGGNAISKSTLDNANDIAWKTMILALDGITLEETFDLLGNVYHKRFMLSDEIKDCVVGMTSQLENKPLPVIIKLLEDTFPIERKVEGDVIHITGEGCQ